MFGSAWHHVAAATCSPTLLHRRQDEWIADDLRDLLFDLVLMAYDRVIRLELADLVIGDCITKAPCGAS